MADQNITVPVDDNDQYQRSWMMEIGSYLDGSSDVVFVDSAGDETNINFINVATDATIRCRGPKQSDSEARDLYLLAGAWHMLPVSKIFSAGTTSSTKAVVALRDR